MSKFKKKPIVIEATQYHKQNKKLIEGISYYFTEPYIDTLEGRMSVSEGDWVITGVNGEKYPCKPDIFELTYEKVEE